MPESSPSTLISDDALDELAARGEAIYEAKLKAILEPEYNNQFVVIHVDTEDYAVGRTFHEANRAMRARYPRDGKLVGMKIGPEPDDDGLAARILLSEMKAARPK